MSLPRTLASTNFGLMIAASMMLFAGCGGGNSEIDNAELIRKEAPKVEDGFTNKATGEASPPKDAAKP